MIYTFPLGIVMLTLLIIPSQKCVLVMGLSLGSFIQLVRLNFLVFSWNSYCVHRICSIYFDVDSLFFLFSFFYLAQHSPFFLFCQRSFFHWLFYDSYYYYYLIPLHNLSFLPISLSLSPPLSLSLYLSVSFSDFLFDFLGQKLNFSF